MNHAVRPCEVRTRVAARRLGFIQGIRISGSGRPVCGCWTAALTRPLLRLSQSRRPQVHARPPAASPCEAAGGEKRAVGHG